MKTKLLLAVVAMLTIAQSFAQRYNKRDNWEDTRFFIGVSLDPKMAIEGPGYNHGIEQGTWNWEAKAGFETRVRENRGIRIGMYFENHEAINYQKWTWIAADFVLYDYLLFFPAKGFTQYAGFEMAVIMRHNPDAHWSKPNNYVEKENSFSPGFNAEIQYRLFQNFSIGTGFNLFRAEKKLIQDGKQFRYDVMVSAYLKW